MITYILYGHTFGSAIEKQPLAKEDVQKQLNNRFEVRDKLIKDETFVKKGDDPFPWLDKEDPRKNLTDGQILENKIKLKDSILTSEEKKHFLEMLETKCDTFSLS